MKDLLKGKTFGEWTVDRTYSCRCGNGVLKPRAVVRCEHGHVSTILLSALFSGEKTECKLCNSKDSNGLNYLEAYRYKEALKKVGKIYDSWKLISVEEKETLPYQRRCVAACIFCNNEKTTMLRNITRTQSAKCKTCKLIKKESNNEPRTNKGTQQGNVIHNTAS